MTDIGLDAGTHPAGRHGAATDDAIASFVHAPRPTLRAYVQLMKPRVMSLAIFTALAGMFAAPGHIGVVNALLATLAIAGGAGAAGALNMWYDADIDAVMLRTSKRGIPSGRISAEDTLSFGIVLAAASVLVLTLATNWVAGGLLAFTIFFYISIYTMWLKRTTPHNIVIGGAAGAFPPMIGWAAVTGTLSLESFVLFLIIFMWTPPHFWSLALLKTQDYGAAGVPMMPNARGENSTRLQILLYTILMAPLGIVPTLMGFAGPVTFAAGALGGGVMIWRAIDVYRLREGKAATKACWQLFGGSIVYLFVVFAALFGESLFTLAFGR